jgi:hypothetical protein
MKPAMANMNQPKLASHREIQRTLKQMLSSVGISRRRMLQNSVSPKLTFGLTEGLIQRGYGDSDIELVLGGTSRGCLLPSGKPPRESDSLRFRRRTHVSK